MKSKKLFVVFSVFCLFFVSSATALTGTQIYLFPDKQILSYGEKIGETTFFWPSGVDYDPTNGINDKTLVFQSRKKGATEWNDDLTLTTKAVTSGTTVYNGIALVEGTYYSNMEERVTFAGDDTYAAAESSIITIYVEPKVQFKAKRDNAKKALILSGKVTPIHKGKAIIIKAKKRGGSWGRLAKVKTDASGNFSYKWPYKSGVYAFVAYFVADVDHAQGESKVVKVRI